MIPPITAVTSLGLSPATSPTSVSGAGSNTFDNLLGTALDTLNTTTSNADTLAVQGATGQANVADVTIAATEAQLAVQLTATVRDDGIGALNSIMSMQAG